MKWIFCKDQLPDSDTTVMTWVPESYEPIWPGYHDGDKWMDMDGFPMDADSVVCWMAFPEPPEV
jgi:hypothetical protein